MSSYSDEGTLFHIVEMKKESQDPGLRLQRQVSLIPQGLQSNLTKKQGDVRRLQHREAYCSGADMRSTTGQPRGKDSRTRYQKNVCALGRKLGTTAADRKPKSPPHHSLLFRQDLYKKRQVHWPFANFRCKDFVHLYIEIKEQRSHQSHVDSMSRFCAVQMQYASRSRLDLPFP